MTDPTRAKVEDRHREVAKAWWFHGGGMPWPLTNRAEAYAQALADQEAEIADAAKKIESNLFGLYVAADDDISRASVAGHIAGLAAFTASLRDGTWRKT